MNERRVRAHTTSLQELNDLRSVVARDLEDAAIEALSPDRRFATAYNAVLQVTKMVLACAGYRVIGTGHQQTTFEALELAMGTSVSSHTAYFDTCRRKRNIVDYDTANVASRTEAEELLKEAKDFLQLAEAWIAQHHPQFKPAVP
ncbi:MAG TPA: SAV_6107 family HEPN domain-containing protein [Dehalococcoidia bacterium]|nr:SAV_6107 family HEPN domain-containing protein [Dehalococcoidia bacterium]